MGYACPVCGDPQADGGHLANHLAFTAILGDDDHEAWLDEHASGWGEMSEDELADAVVDDVEETEFPQVFEDTVGGLEESGSDSLSERSGMLFEDEGFGDGHDHGHDHSQGDEHGHGPARAGDLSADLDPETAAIVDEAREMTREMRRDAEQGPEDAEQEAGDVAAGDAEQEAGDVAAGDADEHGAIADDEDDEDENA
jgi:hypothetical protein